MFRHIQTCILFVLVFSYSNCYAQSLGPPPSGGSGGSGGTISAPLNSFSTGYSPDLGTPLDNVCVSSTNACSLEARMAHLEAQMATLNSNIALGVGISGSTVQTYTVQVGGWDGTNLRTVKTTTAGDVIIEGSAAGIPVPITFQATTTGGASNYILEPVASDNHAVIKNGGGTVYSGQSFNNSTVLNYIRLYDAGTGFNGCNSATGLLWEGQIPSNAGSTGAGYIMQIPVGLNFSTGLSICVTGGYGQTNTTAATATAISIDMQYK